MADMEAEAPGVLAFDSLYTTNQIQKMKILLPYIDSNMRKHMAIYIKYMEFKYTLDYFKKHPFQICSKEHECNSTDMLKDVCRQLCLYSTPEEIKQLEQFQNMLQTMETFQEMSETLGVMNEFENSSNMADIMMNLLSPEQKAMYESFQFGSLS